MSALPSIRDPRKTSLGGVMTKHDIKPRQRWTPLYKAIVALAISKNVLTPEEAVEQFSLSALEMKRWVDLLETQGVRGLAANNFQPNLPEKLDDLPTIDTGQLFINFATKTVLINGELVHLTPNQFKFLTLLIHRAPMPVTREEAYAFLYNEESRKPQWKILDVMVCKMRRVIGEASVETVWGRGWRWNGV